MASISLDAAVGGDVVQDPAQVIFIISKNPYSTKPTVGQNPPVGYVKVAVGFFGGKNCWILLVFLLV